MYIILKVQKSFNKYRLEISKKDSLEIFKHRGSPVFIDLDGLTSELKTTCGPPNNKGFDLLNTTINNWIIEKKFNQYPKGKPTKLNFLYHFKNDIHFLKFKKRD